MTPNIPRNLLDTVEGQRLASADSAAWRRWGPYLSERQWGTVREDYSPHGTAWDYLSHDAARSRAYRWGEDGLAGFGDERLHWCLGLALWNGQDPIIKERLFGLTNDEGNHGEDVKELYFYLDATPTHSYLRMLYKYPQAAFPYQQLLDENRQRGAQQGEYEILDTGVFADGRYFDVSVEYARHTPDDILMQITVENRAAEPATLHLLPQLWARNTWSWEPDAIKPVLRLDGANVVGHHPVATPCAWAVDGDPQWLFCENETNVKRLFGIEAPGPFKDGINDYLVHGQADAVRRDAGTKCAAYLRLELAAHGSHTVRLRLSPLAREEGAVLPDAAAFTDFDTIFAARRREADEFYAALQAGIADADARLVQRQALAGMIWSKQFYAFDVWSWLAGDPGQPQPPAERRNGRDADWRHLSNGDIISMPDKWEYPWFASWDLAFQAVTFALIDPVFAKSQLLFLVQDRTMHPNGQLPAYEWAFGDANPPVQAWATWRVYQMDKEFTGRADRAFLERMFHKLVLNFAWWVNRKDAEGRNVFQGGFLGLDNIEVFDRSQPLPTGGRLDQSDGTAWMAAYALNLMRIALELALEDSVYEDIAVKFYEHFLYISEAMSRTSYSQTGLWDEQDSFFYDVLSLPDGESVPLRVHSIVGLIPLFAVHVLDPELVRDLPELVDRLRWFLRHRPELSKLVSRWTEPGRHDTTLISLLRGYRMKSLLRRMLDEAEFLSEHGVRAVSKFHEGNPFVFRWDGQKFGVSYLPGESDSKLFGGNSNWRGPVWMPINYLLVEALAEFHRYYGPDFRVEFPTGSKAMRSLGEIADALAARLTRLFLQDGNGLRPVMAAYPQMREQPGADQLVLFHEYFHGETGRGVGASHQTGWSGLVALLLQPRTVPGAPGAS